MSSQLAKHIMLVGLPSAGKTSFLAALWYMVDQSKVSCGLKLQQLSGDRKYLNGIRDAWLEYKPVPRNLVDVYTTVKMSLQDVQTGTSLELSIPDLSGESYRLQWTQRQMTSDYDKLLSEATGAILFIHPNGVVKPNRIDTADGLAALVEDPHIAAASAVSPTQHQATPWDIEKAPTQVQLVDILQMVVARDDFKRPFRLAVVVSAFDVVSGLDMTPNAYLERELPFLHQFLLARTADFNVSIYGISAQGGPYISPTLDHNSIVDLKIIVDGLRVSDNAVKKWLMEGLSEAEQGTIRNFREDDSDARDIIIQRFNALLGRKDLYADDRFRGIELRPKTQAALALVRERDFKDQTDLARANRMLLEDAFSGALSHSWLHEAEHQQLQKLPPASRVRVIGANVRNENDITDPIQWLML